MKSVSVEGFGIGSWAYEGLKTESQYFRAFRKNRIAVVQDLWGNIDWH